MSKYIYTESMGNQAFYIVEDDRELLWFVWLDKYGIANIFESMEALASYLAGDLTCDRYCIEPYDTGNEGVDFIDHHFKIGV